MRPDGVEPRAVGGLRAAAAAGADVPLGHGGAQVASVAAALGATSGFAFTFAGGSTGVVGLAAAFDLAAAADLAALGARTGCATRGAPLDAACGARIRARIGAPARRFVTAGDATHQQT